MGDTLKGGLRARELYSLADGSFKVLTNTPSNRNLFDTPRIATAVTGLSRLQKHSTLAKPPY